MTGLIFIENMSGDEAMEMENCINIDGLCDQLRERIEGVGVVGCF
jgi:hypothetical protein